VTRERIAGLAHGWEGAAWVALQRARVPRDLARELEGALREPPGEPGQLVGAGGLAHVAAIAAEIEPSFAPIARAAIARWAASTCEPARDDVMRGHPGALLAAAELIDLAPRARVPRRFVARCHRRTIAAIRRALDGDAPHYLGFAHGLAGLLLAAECGAARFGLPRDATLMSRALARLAGARVIAPGLGVIWPAMTGQTLDRVYHAWCHGTPGVALALSGCERLSGAREYGALAADASASIARAGNPGKTFCCGQSGRAQILVELYRCTRDRRWLAAARRLAATPGRAHLSREHRRGFARGALGIAYLDARLAAPALPLPATGDARRI
jgi:hypothetical protein